MLLELTLALVENDIISNDADLLCRRHCATFTYSISRQRIGHYADHLTTNTTSR